MSATTSIATVTAEQAGSKAVKFLRDAFPDLVPTKRSAHLCFKEERVSVNGVQVLEQSKLKEGDVVSLARTQDDLARAVNQMDVEVCYEDAVMAVVWKPAGVSVTGLPERTLELALPYSLTMPESAKGSGEHADADQADVLDAPVCLSVLNRALAGLALVAKTATAKARLEEAIAANEVRETHRVLCHGNAATQRDLNIGYTFELSMPIRELPATTLVTIVGVSRTRNTESGFLSTLDVCMTDGPKRGQARIHLMADGLPVIGNGANTVQHRTMRDRGIFQALIDMQLKHPITGETLHVQHAEPARFEVLRQRDERFWMRNADATQRQEGEPSMPPAYVSGTQLFYGLEFGVTPDVLVPRPATETVVRAALEFVDSHGGTAGDAAYAERPIRVLDLGTGSGCILLSMLHSLAGRRATGVGLDVSTEALAVAQDNADRLGLADRVSWTQGTFETLVPSLAAIQPSSAAPAPFDVIVCNPPYVNDERYRDFEQFDVHEPRIAIIAGRTGYECYETICDALAASDAALLLQPERTGLVLEVGHGMARTVGKIFTRRDPRWQVLHMLRDDRNLERAVVLLFSSIQ